MFTTMVDFDGAFLYELIDRVIVHVNGKIIVYFKARMSSEVKGEGFYNFSPITAFSRISNRDSLVA